MTTTFSPTQYATAYPDGIERHWWTYARSELIANAIEKYAAHKAPVLEVGCGRGVVVKHLRAKGINAYGVELASVEPLADVDNYVTAGNDAMLLPESERARYQTLLLLDVIEHLPDPQDFIQKLAAAFPNVERLLVTVPAGQRLWSNYDGFYGHLRRYSLKMLQQLASDTNMSILHLSYFFHAVYLPARFLTMLGKDRQTQIVAPRGWQVGVHRLLALLFKIEYWLLPRSLPGSSAIACYAWAKS